MDKVIIVVDKLNTLHFDNYRTYLADTFIDALGRSGLAVKLTANWPLSTGTEQQQPNILGLFELYVVEYTSTITVLKEIVEAYAKELALSIYSVNEREDFGFQRVWSLGEQSPGMKMISLITRKREMSEEEFDQYWSNRHRQKALSYEIPLWRYQQNKIINYLEDSRPFDGISLLHFKQKIDFRNRWLKTPIQAISGAWDATRFMEFRESVTEKMVEVICIDNH